MPMPLSCFKVEKCHWACLTILMFLAPPTGIAEGRVEVNFDLPQSSVTANEPVYLRFSIQNGLKEKIGIDPATGLDSPIDLEVSEPDGSTLHLSPPLHGGLQHVPALIIPPNSRKEMSTMLNVLYQFKKPGDYMLKVRLSGSLRTESGMLLDSPAQELRLIVGPRDPQRLEEICQKLAKAAAGYSDYEKLGEAAVALSYIDDPVAVPYLGQVVAYHNFVSRLALPGLVRIGSPEALQVLKSNLNTADAELKLQIEGAIREIETGVHPQIMD